MPVVSRRPHRSLVCDSDLRRKDDLEERSGIVSGALPDELIIEEDGVRFAIDVVGGPKTGFFIETGMVDDQGNPIASNNPTKATVYAPAGTIEIIAQQVKDVFLQQTQRLSFAYKFDERLRAGNYVVGIYCDKGLLGASSFRLGK